MYGLLQHKALFLFAILLLVLTSSPAVGYYLVDAQKDNNEEGQDIPDINVSIDGDMPIVRNTNLGIEVVAEGLEFPTTIAFIGPNDILVLEKEKGTVQRIVNGKTLPGPLLDVNVATSQERCMCGVAISKHIPGHIYVFLYYTEAESADAEDVTEGKDPIGNRLYV
jgi:aldose sugar dehydrogenase